jgi:hypothetical protein
MDHNKRIEILKAVKMSMLVFWVVTPCELIGHYNLGDQNQQI